MTSIDLETVARIRACHTPMAGGHHCIQCFGDVRVPDEDCAWPCATVRLCDAWSEGIEYGKRAVELVEAIVAQERRNP